MVVGPKQVQSVRVRKPTLGGLADVVVDGNEGYESIVLPARVIDGAPGPAKEWLKKLRVRKRRLSDGELVSAGLVAGIAAEIGRVGVLHPIDTLRARAQAQSARQSEGVAQAGPLPALLSSFGDGSSFAGLWAGVGVALLTAAPQAGVFFAVRELVRRDAGDAAAAIGVSLSDGAAGWVALVCASLAYWAVRAPADVLKQQQQLQSAAAEGSAVSPGEEAGGALPVPLWRYIGLGARAYPACVIADVPATCARVATYRAWKEGLAAGAGVGLLQDEIVTVSIACAVAALTTPLDVWRTRTVQLLCADTDGDGVLDAVQPGFKPLPGAIVSSDPTGLSTSLTELRATVEQEGTGVLFAGLTPRLLFNGLCIGATAPLRATGYFWVRDALILQLFDQAQSGGGIGLG